jgi:hypothetical protein
MRIFIIIGALLLLSQVGFAQRFAIKGVVNDTLNNALPSSTVMLLHKSDSSLVNFAVTNPEGKFEIKNITKGDFILKITFMGYFPYFKSLNFKEDSKDLDLGLISMKPLTKELMELTILGERDPIKIKKDTIEYNAGSFKTRPNASVEELLKRLPGLEVENDGTITAQGETVRRVTVDGKEFFGRDPKIATRNLTADAISKVQVVDQKSEQAQFTGIEDGVREKTINLELKEDKKNSTFGKMMAGAGTAGRFESRVNLNRFSKGNQLSFLGMGNNVNEQGFSVNDYMNFTGAAAQMAGGGAMRFEFNNNNQAGVPLNFGGRPNGIMNSYAGGINFSQKVNKNTDANGSYFLNHQGHVLNRDVQRENFFPSGNIKSNQNSLQNTTNTNHRANLTVEHKIDSANSIRLNTYFGYTQNSNDTRSESTTMNSENAIINEGDRLSYSDGTGLNLNSNLLYRHKFKKKGRTFSATNTLQISQNLSEGGLDALNTFSTGRQDLIKQINSSDNKFQSWGTQLAFTEPLGKKRYLEASYNFSQNLNQANREVFDIEENTQTFNDNLSNRFNSNYTYHRAGLNFRMVKKKYNLVMGSAFQNTDLTGNMFHLDETISRNFRNFLPNARLNFDLPNNKRLGVNYLTSVQEPTIQQLQPAIINNDPLNIYVGNPELIPAYTHQMQLNFNLFNATNFLNFFSMANIMYTTNAIINAQSFDELMVRTTMPVNVRDNLNANAFFNFSFPVKRLNSRFHLGSNLRHNRGINLLNDIESNININAISGNLRYEYKYKEIFDIALRGNLSLNQSSYEFNAAQNQFFYNRTFGSEGNFYFLKNYHFNSTFEYMMFDNPGTGFSQNLPLWNMSLSANVLKGKKGEIRLSGVNLLNQSMGINQVANINYIEQERLNNLGRYFMLSFTYSLNKQLNPFGGGRGGIMMRMNN